MQNILKWVVALTASTLLYGATNSSEEIADSSSCCPPKPCCTPAKVIPMPACEVCQDPCCPPMSVYNRNVNPPAHCMGMCQNDLYVTGAFLWWLPDEADFSLGFNQQTPYVAATATTPGSGANGNLIRFGYQWDPGFRVGLGWQSHTAEGWDVYLDWTWYKNKTNQSASAVASTAGAGIIPYWGFSNSGAALAQYANMKANWRLLYNMIDLELGRDFFVSCALSLRPYMGVEGGWIHRKWNVSYSGLLTLSDTSDGPTESYSNKSNYWGVGPRAGLGGHWWLGKGFNFFGNLSGSLLSGRVIKNSASFSHPGTTFPFDNSFTDNQIFRIVPHLQAIVGAAYDICFCCDRYRFSISAGWEVNEFWNIPMALYPDVNFIAAGTGNTGVSNRENRSHNLGLSGLTAEARFEF